MIGPYAIYKYRVSQKCGGQEEGGWWYDTGDLVSKKPVAFAFTLEGAYKQCRKYNEAEHDRRKAEEDYGYSSVLSYKSTHFSYAECSIWQRPRPYYPEVIPHYE